MEQTFMTIHNLTPDANILYASESIADILGYYPHEVLGRSCFDYFHPDEVPFARSVHSRGVLLDKAAVLHYARVISRDGRWVSCECCFTIVHDVLVACTSIYRRGEKSERRAIEAPQIRRIFSCSPRDPRYHMLEHLSPKFKMPPMEREPRAALILNRFTRTLSVMFATEAISSVLGVSADMVKNKSFYECIQESSLDDAFNCLESAKANDSIAYLRFWSRDPRRPEDFEDEESEGDDEEEEDEEEALARKDEELSYKQQRSAEKKPFTSSRRSSDSDGGVKLEEGMELDSQHQAGPRIKMELDVDMEDAGLYPTVSSIESRTASSLAYGSSSGIPQAYDTPLTAQSSPYPTLQLSSIRSRSRRRLAPSVELEAVVSCTSDGLVVVLRRARPQIPELHPPLVPLDLDNGLFAAPWAQRPIQPHYSPETLYTFRPPFLPQYMPLRENVKAAGGPPLDQLMRSIRDVAVFAWALVGINGNIAAYSRGSPRGDAQPPDGLPIWDPSARQSPYSAPENQAARRWARNEDGQGGSYRQNAPGPAEGSTHRPMNHAMLLDGQANYYSGRSSQWPGDSEPRRPSQSPSLGQIPSMEPSNLWQQGQAQLGTFPTAATEGWNDVFSHHEAGNYHFPASTPRDRARDHRYVWHS
ncbi:Fc.00g086380.m01.CDS01 [Cosmosporella sp. VM-42]